MPKLNTKTQAKKSTEPSSRKLKTPKYKNFKLTKRIKTTHKPLPGALSLLTGSWRLIKSNRALFAGFIIVNSLLSLVFVSGLGSSFDFVETKNSLEEFLGSEASRATTTLTLFGYLIGSAGSQGGEVAGTYQLFLTLITSLAVIWAVRQVIAGEVVRAKEAYYRGLYPLVPFLLVLFVIGLQLLPAAIGTSLYSIVISGGIAVSTIEKILWLLLMIVLCLLSFYMIISSLFALYIVTLPDMTPLKALRSARGLVLHRRLSVGLRIIALPLVLLIFSMILLFPIILFLPWLAMILFLLFSSFSLCILHVYMYRLYRELL